MGMETEANENISPPAIRGRGRYILLVSTLTLLVLIGATVLFLARQSDSNSVGLAQPVGNLPTTIHWQSVLQNNPLPRLVAAPGNPSTLYICGYQPSSTTDTTDSAAGLALMRSTDAGVHWHVRTTAFPGDTSCTIAVNTANANDLYTVSININPEDLTKITSVLSRSSNGGQTWTNIAATLILPSKERVAWAGSGLMFVGRRLFAKQNLHGAYHLISSDDGGQIWNVVDAQLFEPHQELLSYAVDPFQASTIYELVGPIVHFEFRVVSGSSTPQPMPTPAPLPPGQLYKTTDGGSTWQELLASVPYGSKIRLANSNSHLLYLGGFIEFNDSHAFQMQTSRDGGATWQTITPPANTPLLNNWFVDATGLLYDTVKNIVSARTGKQALTPVAGLSSIRRYNPSTNQWSILNIPTGVDSLLAITPDISHNGDIIWMANIDGTLFYRGTA